MIETVLISLFMVAPMCGLACLFGRAALKNKLEKKWVKCGIAAVCAFVAAMVSLSYIYFFFVSQSEDAISSIALSMLVGNVLFWGAMFYVKGYGKKCLFLFAPVTYYICWFVFSMLVTFGADFPMDKTQAKYKTHEDVVALLGVSDIPGLDFYKAAHCNEGCKVWMKLENDADSTKLYEVFERMKVKHPLQICNLRYYGDIFMFADNEREEYTNVKWMNDGLFITYGYIMGLEDRNKQIFDSIQAPFPDNYTYVTYMPRQIGPDWEFNERIEFDEPIPVSWLERVRLVAKENENLHYDEDRKCYHIRYDNAHIYTNITLYKNLNGKRKIADINWGDY